MPCSTRRLAALATALALCALADAAAAQRRDFSGQVRAISASMLVVESRRGETMRFERREDTRVEGRPSWDAIRAGDRVVVRWSLGDGPHQAHRVIVLPGG